MNAPTVPVRSPPGKARAILLGSLAILLVAGVALWQRHARPVATSPVARAGTATQPPADETARLREFAQSVARRVVLLLPGESLPPHFVVREYRGGYGDDEPKGELVSPAMVFERALWDAAAARRLEIEPARAALRDFAWRAGAGAASDFLDPALARFVAQDYAGAERLALAAAAEIERVSGGDASGDSGARLLRVIADSGHALSDAAARKQEALRLAGDAAMLQSKFWDAEKSYRAAAQLVSRTDAAAWIDAQWRITLATGERARSGETLELWRAIVEASTTRYGPDDRRTLTARSWGAGDLRRLSDSMLVGDEKSRADPMLQLLAIRKQRFGPDDLEVGRSLYHLSGFARDESALAMALESLHIREKRLGPEHPEVLQSLRRVVELYHQQAHAAILATNHARRALALSERIFGPEHPEVATDALALAEVLEEAQSAAEIVALHRRALALRTAALGWDHPDVAKQRHALDSILGAMNKPLEAEAFLRRRAETFRQQQGPEHLEVAQSLAALGRYLDDINRPEESIEPYRQTLAICDVRLGDEPEDVHDLQTRLALLSAQKEALTHLRGSVGAELGAAEHLDYRETQAQGRLLKTRLELAESQAGTDHPDVADHLEDYAEFVANWGKPMEAEPLFRRLFEMRLRLFGPEEFSTIEPLRHVYDYQERRGALQEWEALARWMLEYQQKWPRSQRTNEAERLYDLATVLRKEGKSKEYEAVVQQAFAAWDTVLPGLTSPHLEALQEVARYYRQQGRNGEAEVFYRRALLVLKESGYHWEDQMAKISAELGEWLVELARYAEAEGPLRDAGMLFRDVDKDDVCQALGALGVAYARQGKYAEAQPCLSATLAHLKQRKADLELLTEIRRTGGQIPWELNGRLLHFASGVGVPEWLRDEPQWRAPLEKCLAETQAALAKTRSGSAR